MTPSPRTRKPLLERLRENVLTIAAIAAAIGALLNSAVGGAVRGQAIARTPARLDSIERTYVSRAALDTLTARVAALEQGQRATLVQLAAIYRRQLYSDCIRGDTLPDICTRRHLLGNQEVE